MVGVPPRPVLTRAKSAEVTPVTPSLNVTVQLTLAPFAGDGAARVMELTVGEAVSTVVTNVFEFTAPEQLPEQLAAAVFAYVVPFVAAAETVTGIVTVYPALFPPPLRVQ